MLNRNLEYQTEISYQNIDYQTKNRLSNKKSTIKPKYRISNWNIEYWTEISNIEPKYRTKLSHIQPKYLISNYWNQTIIYRTKISNIEQNIEYRTEILNIELNYRIEISINFIVGNCTMVYACPDRNIELKCQIEISNVKKVEYRIFEIFKYHIDSIYGNLTPLVENCLINQG